MQCPYCGSEQLVTSNSRATEKGLVTWRRKKCLHCGQVFTTKEKIDLSNLLVVKKSRKKVRYQRCKLYSGIYNAAREGKHADRGAMAELTEQITDQVEAAILRQGQKVISSQKIGELVMDILSRQYPELFLTYFAYFQGDRGKRFVRQLLKGI